MRDPWSVIRRPILTDKGNRLRHAQNQYFFEVAKDATKIEIKQAIEKIYKARELSVASVRTMNVKGKRRRVRFKVGKRRDWKKAIVTLRAGDQIELM